MLWEGNILLTLKNRELGNWRIPVNTQHKVLRKLIGLDGMHFNNNCHLYSKDGYNYYNDRQLYLNCKRNFTIESSCMIKCFKIPQGSASTHQISDVMFPLNPNSCICNANNCLCFKKYCFFITLDQWLLWFDCKKGVLIDEIFVRASNYRYFFKFCKWSGLDDLNILKAYRSLGFVTGAERCMMAVFNSKVMFKYVFEVEQRVFGKEYRDVDINEQLFYVYIDNNVQIYSFADLLKEGVFVAEDIFEQEANEGSRKTLKINFKIQKAPPVLFDVNCYGNPLVFGIDPHLCLIRKTPEIFFLKNLKQETEVCINVDGGMMQPDEHEADYITSDNVVFHAMIPNMILVKQKKSVQCLKIVDLPNCVELEEAFLLKFPNSYPSSPCVPTGKQTILAVSFEKSVGLIGILGYHPKDPERLGFVKLFDGSSGEEVGSIKLSSSYIDESRNKKYFLFIDLDIVVVFIERQGINFSRESTLEVYGLCRPDSEYVFWLH